MPIPTTIVIAAALTIAVITDLRSRRIPNWLTFPVLLAGLAYHGLAPHGPTQGGEGLLFSLSGLGLGLAVMLVPYLLGFMGGGDVKLMAATGAWLGANDIFTAFLFTSLAGGVYALAVLVVNRTALKGVWDNLYRSLWLSMVRRRVEFAPGPEPQGAPRLCYGVAIAVGTMAVVAMRTTGFIV